MPSLRIEVSGDLHDFLEERAAERGMEDAGAYLVALASEDQARRDRDAIEALVLEGLESGPVVPMDQAFWADLRREVRERVAERRGGS